VTKRTARVVLTGQTWLASLSVVAVTALAFRGIVDGAAAIATILALMGVTTGSTRAVRSRVEPPSVPQQRVESGL
jgi:hypothetical protein